MLNKYKNPLSRSRCLGRLGAKLTSTMVMSLSALVALAIAVVNGGQANAWGPTRQTFTMESPATYVTFDSITNNPDWGDERGFTVIKDVTDVDDIIGAGNNGETAASAGFENEAEAIDGHVYMVKMFVHNNAAANYNLVAKNTRLMTYLPTASGDSAMIQGMISADNCGANLDGNHGEPCTFWDEAYLKSSDENKSFKVSLIDGSVRYYNNVKNFETDGFTLDSDKLLSSDGALVGYENMDGNLQGCFQYSGYATFLVQVKADQPSFTLIKRLRVNGGEWSFTGEAKPGDTVEYRIDYDNVGATNQMDVIVRDTLANNMSIIGGSNNTGVTGLKYVSKSAQLINADNPRPGLTINNDDWMTKGIVIGSYAPDSNAIIEYKTTVPDEDELQCGDNIFENMVLAYTQEAGTKMSTTQLLVHRDCSDNPDPIVPGEEQPGAPEAGAGVKTAVISLVAFMICGAVLAGVLLRKKSTDKK